METLRSAARGSNGMSQSGAGWRLPAQPSRQPWGRASLTSSTQASPPSAQPCQSRGNLVLTDGLRGPGDSSCFPQPAVPERPGGLEEGDQRRRKAVVVWSLEPPASLADSPTAPTELEQS